MNKEVKFHVLLKELKAGGILPKPPVSIVLGPTGINLEKFCEDFNKWSKDMEGNIDIGVIVYNDLNYSILTKDEYLDFKRNEMSEVLSASTLYRQFKEEDDKQFAHR